MANGNGSWIDTFREFGSAAADVYDRFTDDPVQPRETNPAESVPNNYLPPTQESQARPYDLTPSTAGLTMPTLLMLGLLGFLVVEQLGD